ncbi:MAG: hypothetical protein EXS05_09325 [Planctomycetaceae bacterium]|nr:hypothetical protein [Planctomycetaceae bacterium]
MPHVDTPQSRCLFGIARCDVTPPVGIYHRMWGAATHDRSTGIHRPLTATAVVFRPAGGDSSGGSEQIVIAVDHCLLFAREMEQMLVSVCAGSGAARESLLFAFSHTHAAGLMDLERRQLPGGELIEPYLTKMAEKIVGAVCEARSSMQPATIVYGQGRCDLAAQRDFADEASGQWVCGFNPGESADETLLLARVTSDNATTLATFVNYACHPTTLSFENTLISPDFPGAMREVVENATGAPCVFLQGASGDLGPREGYVGGVTLADRNGRQLGHSALAILEALPPGGTTFEYAGPVVSGATLGIWKHVPVDAAQRSRHEFWRFKRWTVPLEYRPRLQSPEALRAERSQRFAEKAVADKAGDTAASRDLHALIERVDRQLLRLSCLPAGDEFPFPVTLWQMGDALWLAVEAEHYQYFQRTLRERFPKVPLYVITLANGSRPSYLPTADVYDTGIYQETIALLARGSLERLVEAISEQIADWVGGVK